MSNVPLFVWPVGPIINTEPIRYVVNKTDHDLVVDALREQNRVLRGLLAEIAHDCEHVGSIQHLDKAERRTWLSVANRIKAALTATSQPAPPYKEWCRHPEECAGLASCPRNPTCAD